MVSPGQKIKVEKLDKKDGEEVVFDQVLLLEKDNKVDIGCPLIAGVKVTGKVISQGKAKKVIIFKYKAKKRYHLKKGHRQQFTEVKILEISN